MYQTIKQSARKILPKRFTDKYEITLRSILYLLYKGTRYKCNVCHKKLRDFILHDNGEKQCPNCGSLPRNRRLWMLLESEFLKDHHCVLHFSPSKSLYRLLAGYPGIIYESTDISGDFLAQKQLDITSIDEPDEKYDLVICFHILEHVENDPDAIKELYRILKPEGICMIQTPFKEGSIYENTSVKNPADRKKHFGQEDHLRIYSVDGLKSRLEQAGFMVNVFTFSENENNYYGFKTEEHVLIAHKIH
jgi:DNA-directed RNA polymerase subunit RPC12/RpoP